MKLLLGVCLCAAASAQQGKVHETPVRRDSITVTAEAEKVKVDADANADALTVSRSLLQELPMGGSDAVAAAMALLDPGSLGDGGAQVIVDGVERPGVRLRLSEVEEVKINSHPYSAQFRRPGQGRIEVLTKGAAQEWHGGFRFNFRDSILNARNALAATKPDERRWGLEAEISGTVGRGKSTSISLSVEREQQNEQAVIRALTPSGEVRSNFPQPERDTELTARLRRGNWNLRYELERESALGQGVGGIRLASTALDEYEDEHELRAQHQRVWSPRLISEISLGMGRSSVRLAGRSAAPQAVVEGAMVDGGAQRDEGEQSDEFSAQGVMTFTAGRHIVRTGASLPRLRFDNVENRSNFGGTTRYAGLDDLEARRPYAISIAGGDPRLSYRYADGAAFIQDDFRFSPSLSIGVGARYDWQTHLADRCNFAPRASLAWSPGWGRGVVFRAGAGFFYDQTGLSAIRNLLFLDGKHLYESLYTPGDGARRPPSNQMRFAEKIESPYLIQFSGAVETQVTRRSSAGLTVMGHRGVKLFRTLDRNAPAPPEYDRPDQTIGALREVESAGRMSTSRVELTWRGQMTEVFSGFVSYAWSRARNNTGGIGWMPPNSLDLSREWGWAEFDQRHRFRVAGAWKGVAGMRLGIMFEAGGGRPYEWTTGLDANRDGRAVERPAQTKRNALRGPGQMGLDIRLSREFELKFGRLVLSGDAFNVLNKANYSGIVGNENSQLFGQPTSARQARWFQFGGRWWF